MKRYAALVICLFLLLSLLRTDSYALSISVDNGTLRSLAQYETYISQNDLPTDFVHVSRFEVLGAMYSASFDVNHRSYFYKFKDDMGQPIPLSIRISHDKTQIAAGSDMLTELPFASAVMLTINPPQGMNNFYYFQNGLYYVYQGHRLRSIEWFANGIHFQLPIEKHKLSQYKFNPILIQLLSAAKTEENTAIARICESAGLELQTEHFQNIKEPSANAFGFNNRNLGNAISTVLFSVPIVCLLFKKQRLLKTLIKKLSELKKAEQLPAPSLPVTVEIPVSAYVLHESPFDTPNTH